jgi:glycosyltransferase involved in cell wall biosynthesis
MRILFIIHFPNPRPGAAWMRISFFAKYLKDMGHSVTIGGAFSLNSISKAGITKWNDIRIINITPIISLSNTISIVFNNVSSLITSIPLIAFFKWDIIVISVPPGESTIGSFLIAKMLRKKIVFDYRDEWEDYKIETSYKSRLYHESCKLLKKIMSFCYKKSNLVIAVTSYYYKSLSSRGIKKVKIIRNGADCNIFLPSKDKKHARKLRNINYDDFLLIYSGGIGGYYKIDLVMKALRNVVLRFPKIKLLIIGYYLDATVKDVISLSKEMGVDNNIIFLGTINDRKELAGLISCCDIGIVPYDANPLWKNSIPVKSLEYFACGLPVIATVYKDSLLGKLIEENGIGMISEPENVDSLVKAIEEMYHSDLASASQRAVSLIKTHYDRNNIAKEFLNLLENVVKS